MKQPLNKHGHKFVGFVSSIVFAATVINSSFIYHEISQLNQLKPAQKSVVLGEQTVQPPPGHVPEKLLVKFNKNPNISFQQSLTLTIPIINYTITLRQAGLKSKTYGSALNNIMAEQNVKAVKSIYTFKDSSNIQVFQYTGDASLPQLRQQLNNTEGVDAAGYSYYTKAQSFTPDDPDFNLQWNMSLINMEEAWDLINSHPPLETIGVAVIDTGIAYENYTDNNWGGCLPQECWDAGCGDIICGYTSCVSPGANYAISDDFEPSSFLSNSTAYNIDLFDEIAICMKDPYPCDNNPEEHPNDDYGHGTHVASTIAQVTNNQNRFAGISNIAGRDGIKLMPIKALDMIGSGYDFQIIDALNEIKKYNDQNPVQIKVVNLSLALDAEPIEPDFLKQAIDELTNTYGVIFVGASGNGNNSTLSYPARYDNVISVGAVRYDKKRASYSNYEAGKLDLVAPGGQLIEDSSWLDQNGDLYPDGVFQTTIIQPTDGSNDFTSFTGPNPDNHCQNNNWLECGLYQGTSMAAPHVSGLTALMLTINPNLTLSEVRTLLKNNADSSFVYYNPTEYGAGLIDAGATIRAVIDSLPINTPTPTGSPTPSPTGTINPTATPTPSPNPSPTPTGTISPTLTPTPSVTPTPVSYCGDGKCQASKGEDIDSCYEDCCHYHTIKSGDLNKDCRVTSSDWGVMWHNWTSAKDK